VIPDDIKELAEPALSHRIIVSPSARMKNVDSRIVVRETLASLPIPGAQAPAGPDGARRRSGGWREVGQRP
jgi:MoxR-like ATPase